MTYPIGSGELWRNRDGDVDMIVDAIDSEDGAVERGGFGLDCRENAAFHFECDNGYTMFGCPDDVVITAPKGHDANPISVNWISPIIRGSVEIRGGDSGVCLSIFGSESRGHRRGVNPPPK